ncbi:hypothetical protein Salat_0878500 [Sesamum alatum]|uniref:Uncharacterized protein n=1 Tax=Sesamum alatum TaxID=300844 RepID=A0AAE2CR51_9LAMI|nr:hypothetical protein Salat_0878500 [Sesamum alatum]
MGWSVTVVSFIFLIILQSSCRGTAATRPLEGEQWLNKNLVIQSLPRGPVPPSGGSPCTYIPGGRSRGRCALAAEEGDFSGQQAAAPAAAFPPVMVHFAAATKESGSRNQD